MFLAHVPPISCALGQSITRPLPDAILALVTPPKLRVTILALNYAPEPTGNAPYTASLAEGLADAGHTVRIITGYPHYPEWRRREGYDGWSRDELINGIRVRRLRHHVPSRPNTIQRMHMELSFGVRALCAAWGRPDVVLLVSPALFSSGLVMLRARAQRRRPAIGIWVQDIYSRGLIETGASGSRAAGMVARIESRILRSADGVVAIHERFREHIVSSLGVSRGAVAVIRNWTHLSASPTEGREAFRQKFGWENEDIVVLHAGNMGKKQGLENVINAARIAQSRQSRLRFVLMGDGNQRKHLESLAKDVGNLEFVDPLPGNEFQLALAAADVLLVNELPGVKDMAVPSKLTSYFNAGVPVLAATDQESVTSFEITASGGGIRVNAADPVALVDAAQALGQDSSAASELGARGLRFSRDTLSKSAAVDHYDVFITSLATSRSH
ncbi:glycosyltransferase [Arthrobacter sp. 754]|uniref:glycosyltransferase n=1 Tax=Arthrobacter sp. 754 TaxID=3156315 RepID=UPI0033957BD2